MPASAAGSWSRSRAEADAIARDRAPDVASVPETNTSQAESGVTIAPRCGAALDTGTASKGEIDVALIFGTFMAPFHCPVGQDPLWAYERDLEVIKQMDKLGFEEAWIGEHHSCGHELIPDPMIFIAWAANQTRHIKLGTGVVSLPYHNPLWVADRALFLDRLLRGRFHARARPGRFAR